MSAPSTVPCEAIWLKLHNYRVLPLRSHLDRCGDLEEVINKGVPACLDLHRADFYDLELDDGWAYIHVRDDLRVVYLIAYFGRPQPAEPKRLNETMLLSSRCAISDALSM